MVVKTFISEASTKLQRAGIETARLDCLVLLEDVMGLERAHLLAHPEMSIPTARLVILNTYIAQRSKHTPLAYIRGQAAFYGRTFIVDNHVLIPRPETEAMIDLLKKMDLPLRPRIADIGTGSGCIGITAFFEIANANVYLYDIDKDAVNVALKNVQLHNARVHVEHQDLLGATYEQYDVVLANLPYVPDNYVINTAATLEPKLALFAGKDGLDVYRNLWNQTKGTHHVLTESLGAQHENMAQLAREAGYTLVKTQGLAQHFAYVNTAVK